MSSVVESSSALKCYICTSVDKPDGCGVDNFKATDATESGDSCEYCQVIIIMCVISLYENLANSRFYRATLCVERCTVFVIVILSVRPSACHTRGLCPHGLTYDHDFFTIW